jgi:predicted permease
MRSFLQDLRYGVRLLVKNRGFAAVAVLTLALGIGANTAIFTVVKAVLLSNLPVSQPDQLVMLTDPDSHGMSTGNESEERDLLTYGEFRAMAVQNQVLSGILAADSETARLQVATDVSGPDREGAPAGVNMVSGSYFSVLGVNARLGRVFGTEVDATRDANPVAVISYGFWQSRFGGDPAVLRRQVRIRRTTFDVVGVAPPGFTGITVGQAADIWVPLTMQLEVSPGRDNLATETHPIEKTMWLAVMGRLKPGISLSQANASLNLTFGQYLQSQLGAVGESDRKEFLNQRLKVVAGSHGSSTLNEDFGKPLLVLMAVVGLVLLIACANVANLLLARAASRQKEIAVRVAMGAGSGRLFRQLLTESILLACAGGVIGLALAQWADAVLLRLVSEGSSTIPLNTDLDVRILAFTLAISLLTGILFGVAPAFRAARVDLSAVLKGTSRGVIGGSARGGRMPVGKILVVAQVALSLVLLIVAGLFVHSLRKLSEVQLGYDRDHLLLFGLDPVPSGYKEAEVPQLYREMLDNIRALPGVRAVTLSKNGLFSHSESDDPIEIEGYKPKTGQDMNARFDHVGPNYFSTVGIPVLMGREITVEDGGTGQRVGVINQTMARYYFGNENPIGKRIWDTFPTNRADFIVVGVVADAKYNSVREQTPRRFYVPYFHPIIARSFCRIEVRVAGEPSSVAAAVRAAVKQTAPNLPPIEIHTMNELVGASLTSDLMIGKLTGFFGALAVFLACIGIYGIMAYAVSGRIGEIGIRMALGAKRGDVLWLVLRESLLLVGIGVAIGLPAIIGVSKIIKSLLFGLSPADPISLGLATALMFAVAALAGYIPARRASRTDPLVALRYE